MLSSSYLKAIKKSVGASKGLEENCLGDNSFVWNCSRAARLVVCFNFAGLGWLMELNVKADAGQLEHEINSSPLFAAFSVDLKGIRAQHQGWNRTLICILSVALKKYNLHGIRPTSVWSLQVILNNPRNLHKNSLEKEKRACWFECSCQICCDLKHAGRNIISKYL